MSLRSWAESYTEQGRFSPLGVAFHWLMAALVIFQLGLGWSLELIPAGGAKLGAFALHGAVGIAIFLLAFLRMVWRIMITDPYNDADTQGWRTTLAYFVEHLFYVCFFMLPITGWAMWSAVASPGSIHLLISLPPLPFYDLETWRNWRILDVAEDLHLLFVWVLMIMIPIHIGAALKHHFWDRNDVLQGILPQVPDADVHPEVPTHRRPEPKPPRK